MSELAPPPARFDDEAPNRPVVPAGNPSQSTMVEQARAIADVRAAIMIAREYPRIEAEAVEEMRRACSTKELAEVAFYRVERGKNDDGTPQMVTGPSIDLARELARCYRNINAGHKEVGRNNTTGESEVLAFAWDVEKNNRREQTIVVPHKRGKYRTFDGGTIREIIAGYAARVEREMILACLPVWFRVQAIDLCHETLAKGDGTKTLEQRRADCKAMFYGIDVMADALERKIGRPAAEWAPEDLAVLAVVYKSIRRGESTKEQEFSAPEIKPELPKDADPFEAASAGKTTEPDAPKDDQADHANELLKAIDRWQLDTDAVRFNTDKEIKKQLDDWQKRRPELYKLVDDARVAKRKALNDPDKLV